MQQKLFVVLLGCRPANRHIEQHDVFFGISDSMKSLVPAMKKFWPEGVKNLHVDAYMCVEQVQQYKVSVQENADDQEQEDREGAKLFFINLGAYITGEFEELHKKMLIAAPTQAEAIRISKETVFYKDGRNMGDAKSHIDDKFLLDFDADDVIDISSAMQEKGYRIVLHETDSTHYPEVNIGYFKLNTF